VLDQVGIQINLFFDIVIGGGREACGNPGHHEWKRTGAMMAAHGLWR
jgi:hypothetical protein